MKVKICGINQVKFAKWAADAGSDYLGLLIGITHLAEDKITLAQAKDIIENSGVDRNKFVMVTHLLTAMDIIPIVKELRLCNIQLHDAISIEEIKAIKSELPELFIIKAVHVIDSKAIEEALMLEEFVDAIILDSRTESRLGGTGNVHDWNISATICKSCKKPVFLAGGLTPDNLEEAIEKVKPYGVDANSGLETKNGDKDLNKILSFVKIAKTV